MRPQLWKSLRVLGLATAITCVAGYFVTAEWQSRPRFPAETPELRHHLALSGGLLQFTNRLSDSGPAGLTASVHWPRPSQIRLLWPERSPLAIRTSPLGSSRVLVSIDLPLTLPALGGLALAAGSTLLLTRHTRRLRQGACPRCGYDTRPTHGRCPECGPTPSPPEAT